MHPELRQAYERETDLARHACRAGAPLSAMRHLDVAHVLGQRHVATHWWMLKIAWRRRSLPQAWGQLSRIVLGALGSSVGIVPIGNTGGTDISMSCR